VEHVARIDGRLYGGAAIAVAIAAAEALTDRPALWMTTQFVATADRGATVEVAAEVLAQGSRTCQVRVTGTSGGDVMFASLGATGRHRPDGLVGQFENMPAVSPPFESERWTSPISGIVKAVTGRDVPAGRVPSGFGVAVEMRGAAVHEHPDPGPGRVCVWARRRDDVVVTPAVAAFMADMVPLGIAHALGVLAGGTSLDNTIRIGPFVDTTWVLLDLRPHLAVGGYGHGVAHVWSEDGHLLATASQTASMLLFDPAGLPAHLRS
jgi:acyl-CoA thioesterase